jgi:membrane associated rhomboid family serine protease
MQNERTFIDDLKYQFAHGGMTIRLIMVNAAVFLVIKILSVFGGLATGVAENGVNDFLHLIFSLDVQLPSFFSHPWGLLTSIFAHYDFFHFLFNMLFLYFSGRMFESLFDGKRLLNTYLLGGLFGGFLEIAAHLLPGVPNGHFVVGASGAIMAVFVALAFYRPNLNVMLFGIVPVRIIVLAAVFVLLDLFSLSVDSLKISNTAHFAHIGGAIIGALSVQNIHSKSNIIMIFKRLSDWLKGLFRKNPNMKAKKGGRTAQFKTDEEYNLEAKQKQAKIDAILDKISRSGYDSLTKAEKDFLFTQSKK